MLRRLLPVLLLASLAAQPAAARAQDINNIGVRVDTMPAAPAVLDLLRLTAAPVGDGEIALSKELWLLKAESGSVTVSASRGGFVKPAADEMFGEAQPLAKSTPVVLEKNAQIALPKGGRLTIQNAGSEPAVLLVVHVGPIDGKAATPAATAAPIPAPTGAVAVELLAHGILSAVPAAPARVVVFGFSIGDKTAPPTASDDLAGFGIPTDAPKLLVAERGSFSVTVASGAADAIRAGHPGVPRPIKTGKRVVLKEGDAVLQQSGTASTLQPLGDEEATLLIVALAAP